MATTVVLTDVIFAEAPSTRVRVKWSDGFESAYASLDVLRQDVLELDQNVDITRKLALAWQLARSSGLSNIAQVKNKNFTFDLSAASAIKIQ